MEGAVATSLMTVDVADDIIFLSKAKSSVNDEFLTSCFSRLCLCCEVFIFGRI